MSDNNEGLSFAAAIDISAFENGLARMESAVGITAGIVEQAGEKMSSAQMFSKLQAQAQALSGTLDSLKADIQRYADEAQSAMAQGDSDAYEKAADSLRKTIAAYNEGTVKAQAYADAMLQVKASMGDTGAVSAPMLFGSENDMKMLDSLKARIEEIKEAIASAGAGTDTSAMQAQLESLSEKADSLSEKAAKAASSLGADLGGRAVEAQQRMFALNAAVEAQETAIKQLKASCAEAAAELARLREQEASQEEIDIATSKYDSLQRSLKNAQAEMANLQASQIDAQSQWASVSAEVEQHNSVLVKLLGGQEKYNQIVGAMPGPLKMAVSGIGSMTAAAKAFIATPLGAIISAIVLALQALKAWFDSSVEGQLKFAEISGYVSGILGQLKEIVIKVGKALYDAFSNPKQAAKDFIDFLKGQVVNRIKAIGSMFGSLGSAIANVFTGDFDKAKESLKEMGSAYADFLTGVEDTAKKVGNWASSAHEAAKATAEIARGEKELQMETSKWQIQKQKMENQMTQLQTKMYDTSLSKAKRKEYSKQYEDLVKTVGDGEVALAKKALEFQEKKMSLTTNSIEDETLRDELEAKVAQAEGYAANRMRMLQRMNNRINSPESGNADAEANAIAKQKRDNERMLKDLENSAEQARINAMEEGEQKVLAQMRLNHEKELLELGRQKEDYLQKKIDDARAVFQADKSNKGKKFDTSGIALTGEEIAIFDRQLADITKKQENENQERAKLQRQAMNEYLAQWGEYEQKRQAIIDLADQKTAKAQTEGERLSIAAQTQKELASLDMEANKTTSAITKLFRDMAGKTVSELRSLASDGKKALSMLTESEEYDADLGKQLGITKEMWEVLRKSPDELDKIKKAIKDLTETADAAEPPLQKIADGLEEVFSAGGDKEKLDKGLKKLNDGLKDLMAAASVVADAFSALGDAFGSDLMGGIGSGINAAMDAMNGAMKGAQAGAVFGPWGAAAGAAIGLVGSLGSSLAKLHDAKHEKKIQQIQEQIETLEKTYGTLGKEIEKAYSKDASKLIEQQNRLLEQQKALLRQQINEEKAKKKTDEDRIKEWESQIEEIDELLDENKEKAVDAIFGEDLKSAIENFASAYADAWAQGEDRAQSAKDTVKSMMRQMVIESIKAAMQSSEAMERIRQKLQEFYADNVLSDWEQDYILGMAEELQQELDRQFGWADGLLSDGNFQQSGSNGGFTAMSEDTAEELSGRFSALQMTGEKTLLAVESIQLSAETIQADLSAMREGTAELQNIGLLQLAQLEAISSHTKDLAEMNEKLGRIERNTKNI